MANLQKSASVTVLHTTTPEDSEHQKLRDEISLLKTQLLELEQMADTDPLVPI